MDGLWRSVWPFVEELSDRLYDPGPQSEIEHVPCLVRLVGPLRCLQHWVFQKLPYDLISGSPDVDFGHLVLAGI